MLESLFNKVAGLKLQAEETPTQVFFCQICISFKNTFLHRNPLVAASEAPAVYVSLWILQMITLFMEYLCTTASAFCGSHECLRRHFDHVMQIEIF